MDDRQEYVQELLVRIREIANMPDTLAIEAIGELANELRHGGDWERHRAREVLAGILAEAETLDAAIAGGIPLTARSSGQYFADRLHDLGANWPPEIRAQFAGDIAEVRHVAEPVARRAIAVCAAAVISAALIEQIANSVAAERIVRDMVWAEQQLRDAGALKGHSARLRQARERAARYRWQRKLDEAEVAEAGGNPKKAAKLRAEAVTMLKQDWFKAFPQETAPKS